MKTEETVKEIVKKYLKENGYGGLLDGCDCGCFDDDLMPCDGAVDKCFPAYTVPAHCDTCVDSCDMKYDGLKRCLTLQKPKKRRKK